VIVKGIVEGHGGTLAVESAPDAGTRVRVTLPAIGGVPAAGTEERRETATVLVVDDEVTLRDLLLEYLQMWDYGAVPAASGAEALELAQRVKPDLIILDVGMLPMSGVDVLQQLKKDPATRAIPVLLHSVTDDPGRMLALGATDFLLKPVTGTRLREAIVSALDKTPIPLFVLDGDEARGQRIRTVLEETGLEVGAARTLADAVAIPATPAPIIVLGPKLADGDAAPLVARWSADPAFRGAAVLLVGTWLDGGFQAGPGCHVELLRGQRASDAAGRVRMLIARRRAAIRGPASG
jgi:CheY-like chemotaxis protein